MKYLLDTHLILWAASSPGKISRQGLSIIEHEDSVLLFSAASMWEITIKSSLGRSDFNVNPHLLRRGLLDNGWEELPITSSHAIAVEHLPPIHKDPFDRILLAQAEVEGIVLLTTDELMARYAVSVQLV